MTTCLIVDDSRVVRMAIRRIVQEFNFDIHEAEDGEIALQFCQKQLPECIVLDWNMPNINGIEFLHALRKLDDGHKPKVIFCTTENNLAHIQEALMAGADEYIMKPFDKDIIADKLTQAGVI